jgi:hypothetical protein
MADCKFAYLWHYAGHLPQPNHPAKQVKISYKKVWDTKEDLKKLNELNPEKLYL